MKLHVLTPEAIEALDGMLHRAQIAATGPRAMYAASVSLIAYSDGASIVAATFTPPGLAPARGFQESSESTMAEAILRAGRRGGALPHLPGFVR